MADTDDNLSIPDSTGDSGLVRTLYLNGAHHQVNVLSGVDVQTGFPSLVPVSPYPVDSDGARPLAVQERPWRQSIGIAENFGAVTYAAGDALGAITQHYGAPGFDISSSVLDTIRAIDVTGNEPDLDVLVAWMPTGMPPTGGSVGPGDAVSFADSDVQNYEWVIAKIRADDWISVGAGSIASVSPKIPMPTPSSSAAFVGGVITRTAFSVVDAGDVVVKALLHLTS